MRFVRLTVSALVFIGTAAWNEPVDAASRRQPSCSRFHIDIDASKPFKEVQLPPQDGSCSPKEVNGLPVPDPDCNPGAVNPTVTEKILKTKGFTTKCVRDQATTPTQKRTTYVWYGIEKPENNSGKTQTCELDHIVPLVLGGSDHLENLWPQCGPPGVVLNKRYFKMKDKVEVYLARQVRAGKMSLAEAQSGIASDWTQYLDDANKASKSSTGKKGAKRKKSKS